MKKNGLLLLLAAVLMVQSCKKDDTMTAQLDRQLERTIENIAGRNGVLDFQLPASSDLDRIPQDPRNPLTAEKVALGKLLYHETALAIAPLKKIGANTYSCASCHFAAAGFQAGRVQGIGEGGIGIGSKGEGRNKAPAYQGEDLDVQPIRTPTALNVAYQRNMLWNGQFGATGMNVGTESEWTPGTPKETNHLGYEGVEIQAIAGLTVHRMVVTEGHMDSLGYKPMFDAAFADWPATDRYTTETAGLALAAYERTLLPNQAPFQRWLGGDYMAMSDLEKEGAILFFGKAECASCHTGPALSMEGFYALGMKDLDQAVEEIFATDERNPEHRGRGGFTGRDEDMYKFKVPQLYNLKDSPFYGHGGSLHSVREVIAYKNRAEKENPRVPNSRLAPQFMPLNLSGAEIDAITAFIETGLYDPNLRRYEPDVVLSGMCFPNNDNISRDDLGCN